MDAFHHRRQQVPRPYDLLPPERSARRVRPPVARRPDVSDAQFVTVHSGMEGATFSRRPAAAGVPRRSSALLAAAALASMLLLLLRAFWRGARLAEGWLQRLPARAFVLVVAGFFVAIFGAVSNLVGLFGAPAPAAALAFTHVTLTPRDANGMRILVLNGIVENGTAATAAVPPIRADLVSGDRLVASITLAPPTDRLGIGESRGFMARLPHPGGKMPDVRLSFAPSGVSAPRV